MLKHRELVVVRGGGDLATGTICRLHRAGYAIICLETTQPTLIRRTVSLAQCIFTGTTEVEGVGATLVSSPAAARPLIDAGLVPFLTDPEAKCIAEIKPAIVVDAILAKRNIGTRMDWADVVIGLGPGFTAGQDVHAVVETHRGHELGRVYYSGQALPNTGIPGEIGGIQNSDRLIKAPGDGIFTSQRNIGDMVVSGDILGYVGQNVVKATITGCLRGLINDRVEVHGGMKIGDIDPRSVREHCWSISDKARSIAGGVLEAILCLSNRPNQD